MSAPRVEVLPLRNAHTGDPTGEAVVRAFLRDGVQVVTPRRASAADAATDVEKIERLGLAVFRVTFPSRGYDVIACDEEDACDLAQQRWGQWPVTVDRVPNRRVV